MMKTTNRKSYLNLKNCEEHIKDCYVLSSKGILELKISEFNQLLNKMMISVDILTTQFNLLYPERIKNKVFDASKFEEIHSLFKDYFDGFNNKTRKEPFVIYRQCFSYLCRKHIGMSLATIGNFLNNQDHTTIIHSVRTVEKEISLKNLNYTEIIDFIEQKIK